MQALPGPHKWTLGLDVVKTSAEGSVAQCTTGVAGPVADLVTAGRKQQAYQRDILVGGVMAKWAGLWHLWAWLW